MGAVEMGTPPKTSKTPSQEHVPFCPTQMPYPPEWAAAAFQAYYGPTPLPPPGFFPTAPGSGPYMWGPQHSIPPYSGTAPAYAAMYLPGGMYTMPPGTHPYNPYSLAAGNNLETATGGGAATGEKKSGDEKAKNLMRGSVATLIGKDNDITKGPSGSASGTFSQSHGSGSEDSTEQKEEHSQYGSDGGHKANIDQAMSEGQEAKNGVHVQTLPKAISGKQSEPLTSLNIGMDYWNGKASANQSQKASVSTAGAAVCGEFWFQDEKEMKRQKRKQSNRESARRSRLRKQAECEELAARVNALESENSDLRSQLSRLSEKCNKLSTENVSLMEQLRHIRVRRGDTRKELKLDSFPRSENDSFGVGKESGNLTCSVPLA